MTQPEVATILGPPTRTRPSEPYRIDDPPPTDPVTWDYSASDGGVRLEIGFRHGRVIEVSSWIRTLWRDLTDDGPHETLYYLDATGTHTEGAGFQGVYCPSGVR
jgi:hypothetical protein